MDNKHGHDPNPMANRKAFRAREVAEAYGCSVATIYRLKDKAKILSFQPGGKNTTVFFPPNCIDAERDSETEESADHSKSVRQPISGPTPKWKCAESIGQAEAVSDQHHTSDMDNESS